MTTQSATYPQTIAPPSLKLPSDGHSATKAGEGADLDVRSRLQNAMESGKERLTEWKGGFEGGVRARPIQSVLIAAAVGAAIGLLIGRRIG